MIEPPAAGPSDVKSPAWWLSNPDADLAAARNPALA